MKSVVAVTTLCAIIACINSTPYHNDNGGHFNTGDQGVCSSRDIRNSVRNFNQLKGCRVIEGFLMITLINKFNETDYKNLQFPLLTEITEFLLLYRVNGLISLGQLFPNLRVIRGNVLLYDSAFIIYEMMHLQEIGLQSLVKISRGNVRIARNPSLCFVDTIDWTLIASEGVENIFINNKDINECRTCPGKNVVGDLVCPEINGKKLCWSHQKCQILCDAKCGDLTCNEYGDCCDDLCLGCTKDIHECLSCRMFSVGHESNRQCVQKCPANTFAHENRRCVTADECRAIKKPVYLKYNFNLLDFPYIPHDGECAINCPSNFYPDGPSGYRVCTKCVGTCKKECPPATIENIASAQRYQGCTHINGPFTLSIRNPGGHSFVPELETFLSDIEVIEGPLSIVLSNSILSLGFFKKLHTIKGDIDGKQKFGLKVLENQNLRALFTQNVTVEHGRMFFHFNPKLCMINIEEFKNNVIELRNVSKLPPDEVAPNSNGYKTACNVTELDVQITKISHNSVVMEIAPLLYVDERNLLEYLLHYMPAPHQNATMYDGHDAFDGKSWQIVDIIDNSRNSTPITIFTTDLKPYTQYAYFVRTYTVESEQRGGLSPIKYFRTEPYRPDSVTKLSLSSNGSSEISIKWGPPIHANGNLIHYIIKCRMSPDDSQLLQFRDYCEAPLENEPVNIPIAKPNEVKTQPKDKDYGSESGCICDGVDGRTDRINFSDEDAEQLIEFEDELQKTVYVRYESIRQRRDLASPSNPFENAVITSAKSRGLYKLYKRSTNSSSSMSTDIFAQTFPTDSAKPPAEDTKSKMDPTNTFYTYVYEKVNASVLSFTLNQLKHYSYYSISVKACRAGTGDTCGNEMIAYQRTGKIEDADDIASVRVEKLPTINHSTGVRLSWDEPENPNGIIVSYNIRYQRVDIEHAKSQLICVTQNLYHNNSKSYTIPDLVNGNFSFMVMANSLAGSSKRWSHPVFAKIDQPTGIFASILSIFN